MKIKYCLPLILILSSCGSDPTPEPTVEPTTGQTLIPTVEPTEEATLTPSIENTNFSTFVNGDYEFIINNDDMTYILNYENNLISEGTYKKVSDNNFYCTSDKTSFYVYANSASLDIPYLMNYDSTLSNNSYDIDYNFYSLSYPSISYYSYMILYENGVYKYVEVNSPKDNSLIEEVYGSYEIKDNFVFTEEKTFIKSGNVLWDLQCDEGESYYDASLLLQSRKTYEYFNENINVSKYNEIGDKIAGWNDISGYVAIFYKAYSIVNNVEDESFKKDHIRICLSNGIVLIYDFDQCQIVDGKLILPNCDLVIDASFLQ